MHDGSSRIRSPGVGLAVILVAMSIAGATSSRLVQRAVEGGHVIAGRIVDPHEVRARNAVLLVGREEGDSFGSQPVTIDADGVFVTGRLVPATYILQIVRVPYTAEQGTIGLAVVKLATTDVSGVTIPIRKDTAITGRFRMESDNPGARWPTHIVVSSYIVLDGSEHLAAVTAEGAPAGRFVLRNAFGPRVLRVGYTLAQGHRWSFSSVTLNGVDITNVPTDFSEHETGQLDIVFTQHPDRIAGTVRDARGQSVRAPWIVAVSAERSLWQKWATTSSMTQGDTRGNFSLPARPGTYLVRGVPQQTFHSWSDARRRILQFAPAGSPVVVRERERTNVTLTLQP